MANSTPVAFSLPPNPTPEFLPITPVANVVTYQSFVEMNDGSVGATWSEVGGSPGSRTGFVYFGTAPDPVTFATVPGSVTMTSLLISQAPFQHVGFESTITRGPDGFLYLSLWVMRHPTLVPGLLPLPPNEGTYVYRSTDEGVSWTLHGNVQVYGGGIGGGAFGGFGDCGEIYFSDSGRWILPYGHIQDFFGATRGAASFAYSDDLGATWVNNIATHGALYTTGSSRQIAYNTVDGLLYYGSHRSQNPNYSWRASADDGLTWPVFQAANYFSGDPFENQNVTGIASPTGFTWFTGNRNVRGRAYQINNALSVSGTPSADPVLLRNWEGFNASNRGIGMQPVGGGWWAFMDTGHILAVPQFEPTDCTAEVEVTCCDEVEET